MYKVSSNSGYETYIVFQEFNAALPVATVFVHVYDRAQSKNRLVWFVHIIKQDCSSPEGNHFETKNKYLIRIQKT